MMALGRRLSPTVGRMSFPMIWKTAKSFGVCAAAGDIPIPTPFIADGLIVVSNAHGGKAPLFAIRPSAKGDISLAEGATSQ